jgi:predicted nucleotidyltransferase
VLAPFFFDIRALCGWNLHAIVVVGSFAQDEITIKKERVLSDIDIHIIVKTLSLSADRKIDLLIKKHSYDLPFAISFGTTPRCLYRLLKSVEYYESAMNGCVIYGPKSVLEEIRMRDFHKIPEWEGIRLLFNRAFGLLEAFHSKNEGDYAVAKAYLAIAQTFLIFDRRYRGTYRERHDQLLEGCCVECVADFFRKYSVAYRYKMNIHDDIGDLTLRQAIDDMLKALDYYLERFLRCSKPLEEKLEDLGSKFINPYHSLTFFLNEVRKGRYNGKSLFVEPCIHIWKRGIIFLMAIRDSSLSSGKSEIDGLLRDWKNTPQYLLIM